MNIPTQVTLTEYDDEYAAFVEKFKPKKTTDDCYTPANVFEAVVNWVCNEYDVDRSRIVRPFWPGADYKRHPYKESDVVLDNPPFSIMGEIVKFYNAHGVKYFLFAPHLTNLGIGGGLGCCHVLENVQITYENGAVVNTSFVTNLDEHLIIASPELYDAIKKADDENKNKAPALPKYEYPENVVTAAMIGWIVEKGIPYKLRREDAFHVRGLDSQRPHKKAIFGSGFLISNKAAAEKAAAEKAAAEKAAAEKAKTTPVHVWELSDAEREIVRQLDERSRR